MKFISIETENFKKLRSFKTDFTDGLNVIVGDNAKGKSTLLQAIEAALYGVSVLPVKKDNIPTHGQTKFKITLVIRIDGWDLLTITRTGSTAKAIRSTLKDGQESEELVANGNSAVTQYVKELLGLEGRDYNLFVQSKQGETAGILTFGATALMRKVEEFAGVSDIDKVQTMANREKTTLSNQADMWRQMGAGLKGYEEESADIRKKCDAMKRELKLREDDVERLEHVALPKKPGVTVAEVSDKLIRFNKLMSKAQSARERLNTVRPAMEDARAKLAQYSGHPLDISDLEDELKKLSQLSREARRRRAELQDAKSAYDNARGRVEEAEVAVKQFEAGDHITVDTASAEVAVEEAEGAKEGFGKESARLQATVANLEQLKKDAVCPTCGTTLSEHDPEQVEKELKEALEQLQLKDTQFRQAGRLLREAQETYREATRVQDKRASLTRALETAKSKLSQLAPVDVSTISEEEQEIERLGTAEAEVKYKLDKVEQENREAEKANFASIRWDREYQEASDEISKAGEDLSLVGEDIPCQSDIDRVEKAWEEYQREKDDLAGAKREAELSLQEAKSQVLAADIELEGREREAARRRHSLENADEAEKGAGTAGSLAKFLSDRRSGYLKEVWDVILGAASRQLSLSTQGKLTAVSFDDGSFTFEEDGIMSPVEGASGAQKAYIGVALRVGLSRALYGAGASLIFDEPTESMTESNATGLTASLAGVTGQVLLITHREQDQDLASNVISVE